MQGNLGEAEHRMWHDTYSSSASPAKPITIHSPQVTLVRDRIEHHVELDQAEPVGHPIAAGPRRVVHPLYLTDEAFLHAEHRIVIQIRAVLDEHVADLRGETLYAADEMDVRGPVGMAAGRAQRCTHRTGVGDRITPRHDGAQPELASAL